MKKPIKLSKEVIDLLLPRLANEFEAFYLYRSASNWCKNVGFNIAAAYFAKESEDELVHAKKIEQFLVDWNINPELPKIDKPEIVFTDLVDIIEKAYKIEYDLYEAYEETSVAIFKTGDMCVFDFLQFFRDVQTKSVAEYSDMINILTGVESTKMNLLLLEENLFGE